MSKIKLTADHIQLEGLVTGNGNFKIPEDGSIETKMCIRDSSVT